MKRIAYILLACLVLACVFSASAQVTTSPSITGVGQPSNALNRINANAVALPTPPAGTLFQIGQATSTNNLDTRYSFAASSQLLGFRADTSAANPSAVQNGENILIIGARGYGASAYGAGNTAAMSLAAAENWTAGAQGSKIVWNTTPTGSTTAAAVMILGADASLSVTGTFSAAIPSNAAAQTGYLCFNTTGNVFTYDSGGTCLVSREEYKDVAGPITGALAEVKKLKPFWGSYKTGTPMTDHRVQPFFGAHQLEAVDPRLVTYTEGGELHGVRYQNITAVLAAAIQEQQVQIDGLKREVRRLKARGK